MESPRKINIEVASNIVDFEGTKNQISLFTEATYRHERGKAFLMYEETEVSGMEGTKTLLTYDGEMLQIKRFGANDSVLRIKADASFENVYHTPYGTFLMTTCGQRIDWHDEGKLHIELYYTLEIAGENQAPSTVQIIITES
ncbi:MAG: DUF1934 domain-containing protein [Firmicutes bacterium]|nr:DUF1934 domain-containing protein [Bacillota bacterium]